MFGLAEEPALPAFGNTIEECELLVLRHIECANEMEQDFKVMLTTMVAGIRPDIALLRQWESWTENLRWEWELHKAVVSFLQSKYGPTGPKPETLVHEQQAYVRKCEAESQTKRVWVAARDKEIAIERAKGHLRRLQSGRDYLQRQARQHALTLQRLLARGDTTPEQACREVGMICNCKRVGCIFPYNGPHTENI